MLSVSRRLVSFALVILAVAAMAASTAALRTEPVEAAAPSDSTTALAGPDAPNVLLVVTDDQRNGLDVMPSVKKRIQKEGTSYTNAFATTPLCCPSRASIYTGQYSHNHEVVDNQHAGELNSKETLQYFLRKAGYRTGIVGKYLNSVRRQGPPSFRKHAVIISKLPSSYYYGGRWAVTNKGIVEPNGYSTSFIRKYTTRFLQQWDRRDDDKPWFMVVTPTAPHLPATTTPKYSNAPVPEFKPVREKDRSDKPAYVKKSSVSAQTGKFLREKQLRSLMPVDDMVNRVLGTLRALNENSETVVIYMSDNGFLWGEHGMAKKTVPYTEAVKVPLLVKWPGRIPADNIDERLVGNVDIAPTILDAVGIRGPMEGMDGRSLLDSWSRDRILLEFAGRQYRLGPMGRHQNSRLPVHPLRHRSDRQRVLRPACRRGPTRKLDERRQRVRPASLEHSGHPGSTRGRPELQRGLLPVGF